MIIGTITLLSILLFGGAGLDLIAALEKMNEKIDEVVLDESRAADARASARSGRSICATTPAATPTCRRSKAS
jgi:hypothetical protein